MQKSVIHVSSFQGQYKSALVFSMIEGLRKGEHFRIICDQNPDELITMIKEAHLPDLRWKYEKTGDQWQLLFEKLEHVEEAHVGCCGRCGGDSNKGN